MWRRCPGPALLITTALALGAAACSGAGATPAVAGIRPSATRGVTRNRPSPGVSARSGPGTGTGSSSRTSRAVASRHRAGGVCASAAHPGLAARISRGIARALRGRLSVAAVTAADPALGLSCRLHPWREFHSASVIKVITLGALLYQLQQEHQSISPEQATLATAMITESDNTSQDVLWNEIGMPALQAFVNAARMNHTVLGTDDFWGLTDVNAHDELRLLRLLITRNNVLDAASRRYALGLMADVISWERWGVSAGAPADMTVHLKNGWLPDPDLWDINSIGDFTHHDYDYSIAILTRNDPDMAYGVDTVEAVAKLINKTLAEGDADDVTAPEPFQHLLYMQRRFL